MSSLPRVLFFRAWAILILALATSTCNADDILGCGGLVKSHANIDFSKIIIKLYTKTGILKDQTECAPSGGYYFLPVYDKGEYLLKLEPPRGWSFEPTEVVLNVDGSSEDPCTQGKDINFIFKGFGITGKVVSTAAPKNVGPKGVSVSLFDANKSLLDSTITSEGGTFSFTPIQPGKYELVISHPTWLMDKHKTTVIVKEGNTELKDGELSVFGFDVSGRVTTTEGDPVGKVLFLLFGNGRAKNCATSLVKGFDSKKKPLCHVTSDETGRFLFPALSSGEYSLVPHYAGSKTKYDVKPSELSFTVVQDSLNLPQEFKVTGFTISGKVMASIEPPVPLSGVKIFLSKKPIGVTDNNGAYKIDNIKAKQYTLFAEANDVIFEEKIVKVSPNNPELPIITPTAFKVSGKVSSTTLDNLKNRKVLIKNTLTNVQKEIEINFSTGEWSTYLTPAKYQLDVIVSDEEKTKGLQFFPLQRIVDVSSTPLKNINFLQLKATLKGTIVCLPDKDSKSECSQTQVTLKMVDGVVESKTVKASNGEYIFKDVLPGQYEVIVDTDSFCWETPNHQVVIASEKPPNVPPLKQIGFSITFISSHDTQVEYSLPNKPNKKSSFQLPKGSSRHCVLVSGKYEFIPKGCHRYVKPSYTWKTNEQTPIIVTTNEHLLTASILSPVATDGISVKIEEEIENQEPLVFKDLKPVKEKEFYKYTVSFNAVAGEVYSITPSSESLLFDPPSIKITAPDDCQNDITVFRAEQGKIISGNISPALEGVSIKIFGKDKEAPIYTLVTKQDGIFRVGPLDGSVHYSVEAEKEGFVFTQTADSKGYKFTARKLAEINVQVLASAGSIPLKGVLISLSGGGSGPNSYRKNIMTGEDGRLVFNSLSPGEYYLRPTMKEYRFDPASKMIRVEEGQTVPVTLVGRRVAFSAFGVVTCLNGEPEPGLLVEARGQADCADLQEEATTKEDGTWRIRGLEPKCIYAIRLKLNEEDPNTQGLRAIPSSVAVQATQDIYDIKLMALQPVSRTDVSVRIISNLPENYRTLKVKLCLEDSPDSPVHILKLDSQQITKISNAGFILHFPSLQADGKKYFIQLETSLSKSNYEYKIIPVYFEANTSFKYIELNFVAEPKHDHGDAHQITLVPLPLIILVTLAFFNREALSSWLNTTIEKWSQRTPPTSNRTSQIVAQQQLDDLIAETIKVIDSKGSKKPKPRKT